MTETNVGLASQPRMAGIGSGSAAFAVAAHTGELTCPVAARRRPPFPARRPGNATQKKAGKAGFSRDWDPGYRDLKGIEMFAAHPFKGCTTIVADSCFGRISAIDEIVSVCFSPRRVQAVAVAPLTPAAASVRQKSLPPPVRSRTSISQPWARHS